jgi:glycosyltransferase 2 family protein
MSKHLLQFLKLSWLVLIFAAVLAYILRNYTNIVILIREVALYRLLFSMILLLIGRLLIAQLARLATANMGWLPSYRNMLYMMATSELGKYLPGGVWHFAGRAAYYRGAKLSTVNVTRALVFENVSLITSAALSASILLILYPVMPVITKLVVISVLLLIWLSILWIMQRHYEGIKFARIVSMFFLQCGIWLAFSLSFMFVLPTMAVQDNLFLAVGAFPFGWLVGFLTPFAPGGIGTREITLVALLLPILSPEAILVFVAFHRLLWVILELLLGLIVVIWGRGSV